MFQKKIFILMAFLVLIACASNPNEEYADKERHGDSQTTMGHEEAALGDNSQITTVDGEDQEKEGQAAAQEPTKEEASQPQGDEANSQETSNPEQATEENKDAEQSDEEQNESQGKENKDAESDEEQSESQGKVNKEQKKETKLEFGVNELLWRACTDVLSFLPFKSADKRAGVIITEWYSPPESPKERLKIVAIVRSKELRADGIKVRVFRRENKEDTWYDSAVNEQVPRELETMILKKARELAFSLEQSENS